MLRKSVNPNIFANFAIPFGEKSRRSRKALAFFRGPEKSPNYIHKTLGRRIYALLFCLLHHATGEKPVIRIDSTERAFILSFSWVLGVWRCLPGQEKGDEVLSFLVSTI